LEDRTDYSKEPITVLGKKYGIYLRTKSLNAIATFDLKTIQDFLDIDVVELAKRPGIGYKSIREIERSKETITGITGDPTVYETFPKSIGRYTSSADGKARDVLARLGYKTTDDLTNVTVRTLLGMPGITPSQVSYVMQLRQRWVPTDHQISLSPSDNARLLHALSRALSSRGLQVVVERQIVRLDQFLNLKWDDMFDIQSVGLTTFGEIMEMQTKMRDYLEMNKPLVIDALSKFITDNRTTTSLGRRRNQKL
jgi:hypothetical protein